MIAVTELSTLGRRELSDPVDLLRDSVDKGASAGYLLPGVMPRYAASPAGGVKPCAFFYRES